MTLQMSDIFGVTSWADSRSLTGKILFLTTCDAIKFLKNGTFVRGLSYISDNLLSVIHDKLLECENRMELMASFYHSCLCLSRWDNIVVAPLLDFSLLWLSKWAQ